MGRREWVGGSGWEGLRRGRSKPSGGIEGVSEGEIRWKEGKGGVKVRNFMDRTEGSGLRKWKTHECRWKSHSAEEYKG